MPKHGNCLFNCFGHLLYNDISTQNVFRQQAVQYVIVNWDRFQPFLQEQSPEHYSNYMSQNGTYGGHVEITALAEIYSLKVVIHQDGDRPSIFIGPERYKRVIHLKYSFIELDNGHYDVLEEY